MSQDAQHDLRQHVLYLLRGGGAHLGFDDVIADFPPHLRGQKVDGAPHTAWQLVEHLRMAQWDILEFTRNPSYESPEFPAGYWPKGAAPPDEKAWEQAVKSVGADLEAMQKLVEDPKNDLLARLPHGEGQTLLREALVLADHNAYHLGQLVLLRRLLGAWEEKKWTL